MKRALRWRRSACIGRSRARWVSPFCPRTGCRKQSLGITRPSGRISLCRRISGGDLPRRRRRPPKFGRSTWNSICRYWNSNRRSRIWCVSRTSGSSLPNSTCTLPEIASSMSRTTAAGPTWMRSSSCTWRRLTTETLLSSAVRMASRTWISTEDRRGSTIGSARSRRTCPAGPSAASAPASTCRARARYGQRNSQWNRQDKRIEAMHPERLGGRSGRTATAPCCREPSRRGV